jgi:hypothetical protein
VAVRAILSHVGEHRLEVTLNATHFLVHASQRVVRPVVVKLGNRADGAPAGCGVAVFARNR